MSAIPIGSYGGHRSIDGLLGSVASYADQQAQSADLADSGSMRAAAALAKLYEAREWVGEWLEQHPIKEAKSYIGGRPPQADSRNRFSHWLAWRLEQDGHHGLASMRTYQLLAASEIGEVLETTVSKTPSSERTIRPLQWLRKHKYLDRAPEIWKHAVELAGGDDKDVTHQHTSAALAQWKRETFGGSAGVAKVVAASRAEAKRIRAQQDVRDLFQVAAEAGEDAEWDKFNTWFDAFRATGNG